MEPRIRIDLAYPVELAHYPGVSSIADAYRVDVGQYNDNAIEIGELLGFADPDTGVAVTVVDADHAVGDSSASTARIRIEFSYPVDLVHYPSAASVTDAYRFDVGQYNDNEIGLNDLVTAAFADDITVIVLDAGIAAEVKR